MNILTTMIAKDAMNNGEQPPDSVSLLPIPITRLNPSFNDLPLPRYATGGSAGMDVYAAIDDDLEIAAQGIAMVPTALAIALPNGYECQVRSRSGLAAKHGIFALNAPGTIDSDYRGEINIILANFGAENFTVHRGDRIAQLVVAQYSTVEWTETTMLNPTERGTGGFGSTGM